MKRLLIVGAGGFGREVACWAQDALDKGSGVQAVGFLDDHAVAAGGSGGTLPVVGRIHDFVPCDDVDLVVAIGIPEVRRRVWEGLRRKGARFASVVHPTAMVVRGARLGEGVVLAPYSVVSADARLGDGVVMNFHAVVEHDGVVGAWSQLNAHANVCGNATLGEEVLLSTHAVVPARACVPDRTRVLHGTVYSGT